MAVNMKTINELPKTLYFVIMSVSGVTEKYYEKLKSRAFDMI